MTLSINDDRFVTEFVIKEGVVGQVGYGYIGKAVEALFVDHCRVVVYDKFVPASSKLEEVVGQAQVIFVAVPTPMNNETGECYTGVVESVLQDIQRTAIEIGRDVEEFVVVIKSTVPPGFTRRMKTKHALRVVFSPEFLTEANSINDFKNASRVLLGGDMEDARVVYKFFEGVWPTRVYDLYDQELDLQGIGPVVIAQCEPEVAEMVKLTTNGLLATKVAFCNEIYQICKKLGVDYNDVAVLTALDRRIGSSHMKVPGPDGHFGFGGSCFPKDISNLRHVSKELGTNEKLFSAVCDRNEELRPEKDWEQLKGRAVVE